MFFYSTDFEVPLFLSRITQLLGRAMIPMMLVTLGVQLSDVNKFKFSVDVITVSGVRLIGAPIIAFGLTSLFSLSDMQIRSGILQASMPVAVMASIIAIEYNIAPKFVTTTVLFSTICSLITLTVLLYLV